MVEEGASERFDEILIKEGDSIRDLHGSLSGYHNSLQCFQRSLTFFSFKLANGILVANWLTILLQCLFPPQPFLIFTSKSILDTTIFAMLFNTFLLFF